MPIKIEGLFELKQKRKYFARPGSVRIIFGEPVKVASGTDPSLITKDLRGASPRSSCAGFELDVCLISRNNASN